MSSHVSPKSRRRFFRSPSNSNDLSAQENQKAESANLVVRSKFCSLDDETKKCTSQEWNKRLSPENSNQNNHGNLQQGLVNQDILNSDRYHIDSNDTTISKESPQPVTAFSSKRDLQTFQDNLQAIIGDCLEPDDVSRFYRKSDADITKAVNLYFDENDQANKTSKSYLKNDIINKSVRSCHKRQKIELEKIRIGSFGCETWSSVSQSSPLKAGDLLHFKVDYGSQKVKLGKVAQNQKQSSLDSRFKFAKQDKDMLKKAKKSSPVVRLEFGNKEVARIPSEIVLYIYTLIRLEICEFLATVICSPADIKVGSTILIQVDCYILKSENQFENSDFHATRLSLKDLDDEDSDKVLRRLSLLKIFAMTGLQLNSSNNQINFDIENAMIAADYDYNKVLSKNDSIESSESPAEQDQLDLQQINIIYSRAQNYDCEMEKQSPPSDFTFDLRDYQQQALAWMVTHESKDKNQNIDAKIMHPHWISYKFSTDSEDRDLFFNPYTGQISFQFPNSNEKPLGGILADEMGLGKTVEILSLIHTMSKQLDQDDFITDDRFFSRSTLIVCPKSLLDHWLNDASRSVKGNSLKSIIYHSTDKGIDVKLLCNFKTAPDIVITSYGTVLYEFDHSCRAKMLSILYSIKFRRIVLDEAHYIRNRFSKTAKACFALSGQRKWVLTGTPIVNKLDDLFTLIHFLGVEPWCQLTFWKTFITIPFEKKEFAKSLNIVQNLLESIALRRTKEMRKPDGKSIIELPEKTITKIDIQLSSEEKEIYNQIFEKAKYTFREKKEAGTIFKNFTTIFSMLLRLRQCCCHPLLVHQSDNDDPVSSEALKLIENSKNLQDLVSEFAHDKMDFSVYEKKVLNDIVDDSEQECPVCLETDKKQLITSCFHLTCKDCYQDVIAFSSKSNEKPLCHTCRKEIETSKTLEILKIKTNIRIKPYRRHQSAKILRLVDDLLVIFRQDSQAKAVVFTQFTALMPLILEEFDRHDIKGICFHGSQTQMTRAKVLAEFNADSGGLVLLISLKAGGVGLNLSAASHVFMMDPWWSFSIEAQAIDRVHRIGQARAVHVYRYIVQDSVEAKMLKIQERKNFIASSLGMSREEKQAETLQDIMTLFE